MLDFKQDIYSINFNYVNNDFSYSIRSECGQRIETSENIKIFTSENIISIDELKLNLSDDYIINLKKILISEREKLYKNNITFLTYINLNNEKVIINQLEDNRFYGFTRVVAKDCNENVHIHDIPVIQNDPENLEAEIKKFIDKVLKNNIFVKREGKFFKSEMASVALSPQASGYFIHEILGHILESDFYELCGNNYEINIPKKLNIYDSIIGFEKIIGLNKYDDLQNEIKPVILIKDGKINEILAINKQKSFNGKVYGAARRENYKFDVMPRMRCTCVAPCDNLFCHNILNKYNSLIFMEKAYTGNINPVNGDYSLTGIGFKITNGKKQNFVGNLKLSGNISKDLTSIEYIGKDFEVFGNFCIKMGQTIRVGMGAPTISFSDMAVEGVIY